jgi:hypothetical protein
LAHEQAAREALGEAVQLAATLRGEPLAVPHVRWRARVRRRLRPTLVRRWTKHGRPIVWGLLTAAALYFLGLWPVLPQAAGPAAPNTAIASTQQRPRGFHRFAGRQCRSQLPAKRQSGTIEERSWAPEPAHGMSAYCCVHLKKRAQK